MRILVFGCEFVGNQGFNITVLDRYRFLLNVEYGNGINSISIKEGGFCGAVAK